ncbi:uncharacterized protein LOC134467953 [Engraulis encrasicolus]|uniref:uncharacterized protein LOC134467953 n=1 Tax=Engraulis encrasicolus TaxID=184585 RepID=UPI002FD3AF31
MSRMPSLQQPPTTPEDDQEPLGDQKAPAVTELGPASSPPAPVDNLQPQLCPVESTESTPPVDHTGAAESPQNYGSELVTRMDTVFQAVQANTEEQRLKREYYYNRQVRFQPYQRGDLVWIDDPTTVRQKLSPKWTGPYEVVSSNDQGLIYKLLDLKHPHKEPKVIHYDRLKPFRSTWEASEALGHDTPLPRYTALSGSMPFQFGSTDTGQTSATSTGQTQTATGPVVPLMRRPSGRVVPAPPQQTQGTELGAMGPGVSQDTSCTTRSGRTVRRPQRLVP